MKIMWMSFLVIGLFVQGAIAQDAEGLVPEPKPVNDRFVPEPVPQQAPAPGPEQVQERVPEVIPPPVKRVNPAQQAVDTIVNEQDMQNGMKQLTNNLGDRDPFQRPKYIDDIESDLNRNANLDTTEDEKIEAIRRWPLRDYRATAIMWDIQSPKVMVIDRKGTLHLLKKNYRIGNRNGMITAINEGEMIVTENGMPVVIKIEAAAAR